MAAIEKIVVPVVMDGMKYYSHLAAICHILRDNFTEIRLWFQRNHSEDISNVIYMCPRPISKRWGRKTECESYVLKQNICTMLTCLRTVLLKKSYFAQVLAEDWAAAQAGGDGKDGKAGGKGRGRGKKRDRSGGVMNKTKDDEDDAYEKNYGKWSRMALKAWSTPGFWFAAALSNRISDTMDQIMWSLMRATDAKEHEIENLARFVTHHCARVRALLEEMLDLVYGMVSLQPLRVLT